MLFMSVFSKSSLPAFNVVINHEGNAKVTDRLHTEILRKNKWKGFGD